MLREITQSYLRTILDYDPTIGVFTWVKRSDVNKTWNTKYAGKRAGRLRKDGYWELIINKKHYMAHRIAWFYVNDKWPENEIDHKDLDTLNNSYENLREATPSQNQYNQKKPKCNTSGYKGVSHVGNRWIARIKIAKKHIHLGSFDCPHVAYFHYCIAARENHGTYARLSA